jgi:hypothetical protein
MELQRVTIDTPRQVAKGQPFKVQVNAQNTDEVIVNVYDVTSSVTGSNRTSYRMVLNTLKPIATKRITFNAEVPFKTVREVELTIPDYGLYVVVPLFDGLPETGRSYPIVACSNLSVGSFGSVGKVDVVAVDAMSGAPVKDVRFLFMPWNRNSGGGELLNGSTSVNGMLTLETSQNGTIIPQLANDVYSPSCSLSRLNELTQKSTLCGKIFTSLNLYKLGDTVDFSLVAYESNRGDNQLATNRNFSVVLRDANYVAIDTLKVTTDQWGRADGAFSLPADGLTGQFTLTLVNGLSSVTSTSITVSDYKLPTFAVEATGVELPSSDSTKDITIHGRALTYAAFPVDSAQVNVQLQVRAGRWAWSSTSPVFYETTATTAADGTFSVTIPHDVLAGSPAPKGSFKAVIAVTSTDGETHQITTQFNMGKPLTLSVDIPTIVYGDKSGTIGVEALNYEGVAQTVDLNYTIYTVESDAYSSEQTSAVYREGQCSIVDANSFISSLPSGQYRVTFATTDNTLAEAVTSSLFTVYRPGEKHCPVNALVWLPQSDFVADTSGKVCVSYGTSVDDAHVLLTIADDCGLIVSSQWLSPSNGMNTVDVTMPADAKSITLYFRVVKNLTSQSVSAMVKAADSTQRIEVQTETFRDKVVPGDNETVTIKVKGVDGAATESAILLDMSNKAIDCLSTNPFTFTVNKYRGRHISIDGLTFSTANTFLTAPYTRLDEVATQQPAFELYNRSFYQTADTGSMLLSARKLRGTKAAVTSYEAKVENAEVEMAVAAADMADDFAEELSAEASAIENVENDNNDDNQVDYRDAEIPLAFFRPMLQTDENGELQFTYTVPNANTTWILRSLAYNRNLQVATNSVEVVSSKPLMVSITAPRFLRGGDAATIKASVMNATDNPLPTGVKMQLVDAELNTVLGETVMADTITGGSRKIVALNVSAPINVNRLVVRVVATANNFSDGEQVLVPVLPSDQDITESTLFYLAPNQTSATVSVEPIANGRAYFTFTENPAWEVVSALPGLRETNINSSVEAAAAIFSAAVADGLMKNYPEIARVLRRWRDNPSDSALVSQLEQNEQLKNVLLNSTPWVSTAMSQNERMQRLVLLLDSRYTKQALSKAIAALAKTAVADGGWSWTPRYPEVSLWATYQVLDMMGDLNAMGWLPNDSKLTDMINKAVRYVDRQAVADYAKYPKHDYTRYCYIRSKFGDVKQSSAAAKVTKATIERIIANWKDHSLTAKAVDAIILNANNYNATAKQVLESLRQLSTSTTDKGMWWQQLENTVFASMNKVGCTALILDAFAQVEPTATSDIEAIRQWLILNKVNCDWGNSITTTKVIGSVLTSGKPLTVNANATAIHIGDALLQPESESYAIGAFTMPITDYLNEATTITVDRRADYPSVGAVVRMERLPMSAVRATGCNELTVDKQLTVFNGMEWVPATTFAVGDRVKVVLTVKANTDIDYVVLEDARAATFEPVEQLPQPIYCERLCFYQENGDSKTNIFINAMPRGTYVLTYELFATESGTFASGVAQVQSHYNPAITAHSAGSTIVVNE